LKQKRKIDPKDLMAVERSVTGLIGTAISLIVLGFVVEKFELFLRLVAGSAIKHSNLLEFVHASFYKYLGIGIILGGIVLTIYSYFYYIKWIKHLERKEIDTDKSVFLYLSLFISFIGIVLIASMLIL